MLFGSFLICVGILEGILVRIMGQKAWPHLFNQRPLNLISCIFWGIAGSAGGGELGLLIVPTNQFLQTLMVVFAGLLLPSIYTYKKVNELASAIADSAADGLKEMLQPIWESKLVDDVVDTIDARLENSEVLELFGCAKSRGKTKGGKIDIKTNVAACREKPWAQKIEDQLKKLESMRPATAIHFY